MVGFKKSFFVILIILLGVFSLMGCEEAVEEGLETDGPVVHIQQKERNPETMYTATVRFVGLADGSSGEFEILDFEEDFLDETAYVFRFSSEIIEEFQKGYFKEEEELIIQFRKEETPTYRVLVIHGTEKK